MMAPSVIKVTGDIELSTTNLISHGWKEVKIGTAPMINHSIIRYLFSKRRQWIKAIC